MKTVRAVVAIWTLFSSGCALRPVGNEKYNPAPSSHVAMERVTADAAFWALLASERDRTYGSITPTSSMTPLLDSRSIALLEAYRPDDPIFVGDVICFNRGDAPNVQHRVEGVTKTHVYVSGWNNPRADGWFPKTTIKYKLAGVLYSRRNIEVTAEKPPPKKRATRPAPGQ
jgi:hypothetical protein